MASKRAVSSFEAVTLVVKACGSLWNSLCCGGFAAARSSEVELSSPKVEGRLSTGAHQRAENLTFGPTPGPDRRHGGRSGLAARPVALQAAHRGWARLWLGVSEAEGRTLTGQKGQTEHRSFGKARAQEKPLLQPRPQDHFMSTHLCCRWGYSLWPREDSAPDGRAQDLASLFGPLAGAEIETISLAPDVRLRVSTKQGKKRLSQRFKNAADLR